MLCIINIIVQVFYEFFLSKYRYPHPYPRQFHHTDKSRCFSIRPSASQFLSHESWYRSLSSAIWSNFSLMTQSLLPYKIHRLYKRIPYQASSTKTESLTRFHPPLLKQVVHFISSFLPGALRAKVSQTYLESAWFVLLATLIELYPTLWRFSSTHSWDPSSPPFCLWQNQQDF